MHRAYNRDMPAIRIVASGLKDSVGLYVKPSAGDYGICRMWMRFFGIEDLAERTFLKLSSGEQRMVLLARAFQASRRLEQADLSTHTP
jgi:molybdate transport system ATP-binding protein